MPISSQAGERPRSLGRGSSTIMTWLLPVFPLLFPSPLCQVCSSQAKFLPTCSVLSLTSAPVKRHSLSLHRISLLTIHLCSKMQQKYSFHCGWLSWPSQENKGNYPSGFCHWWGKSYFWWHSPHRCEFFHSLDSRGHVELTAFIFGTMVPGMSPCQSQCFMNVYELIE